MNFKISLADNKYTFVQKDEFQWECLRHGEPWRDFVGDNAISQLLLN